MADVPTHDELSKMKVADLKKLLKAKGLSMTGTKSDLVERLKTAASAEAPAEEDVDVPQPQVPSAKTEQVTEQAVVAEKEDLVLGINTPNKITSEKSQETTSPVPITSPTSDTDRLKKRAERFGVANEQSKKLQRAERFGVVSEDLKKQQRAERFGITSVSTLTQSAKIGQSADDVDKLKERAKRFGQVLSSSLSKVDEDERIKKRKDRFGDVTAATNNKPAKFAKITYNSPDDDMKKKRAERFGMTT